MLISDPLSSRPRRAATLVEVALGAMFLSALLIPSIKLASQAQQQQRQQSERDELLLYAEDAIEWSKLQHRTLDETLSWPSSELPSVRTRVVTQSHPTYPTELLNVHVESWNEKHGNRRPEPDETLVTLDCTVKR